MAGFITSFTSFSSFECHNCSYIRIEVRIKEIMHVKHIALAYLRALKWKLVKCQLGVGDGQGSLACCSPWGRRVGRDWATELNWKSLGRVWLFVTPWKPMDYTVHGILQARVLGWVAFPFSRGSSQPRDWTQVFLIAGGFFTIWATTEAPEYWSGQPIPSLGDLPDPGIELESPALQVDSLPTELPGKLKGSKTHCNNNNFIIIILY